MALSTVDDYAYKLSIINNQDWTIITSEIPPPFLIPPVNAGCALNGYLSTTNILCVRSRVLVCDVRAFFYRYTRVSATNVCEYAVRQQPIH